MLAQAFQIVTLIADVVIFIFVGYYLLEFRVKEKELDKKEEKIDTNYHQVVDNALSKERKILEDATNEANVIITGAQYITTDSKKAVDHALEQMVVDINKESATTAQNFMTSYQTSLQQLANQSLAEYQNIMKGLEADLKKQVKDFHDSLLPDLKKELDEYKEVRMQQAEQLITAIIRKVSQEVLNKSISLEDHQALLIESLERAKKEGIFS